MTLQRRLEGVYRQYGPRRPDVAFATAEVLRSAIYEMRGGSPYLATRGPAPSSLTADMEAVLGLQGLSEADAVALYFQKFIGERHFYDEHEPIGHVTRFDRLVPWVAKTLVSDSTAVQALLRPGTLGRIADWFEAERPDVMALTLKQVLHRERRWHAAFARKKREGVSREQPGEIVMRFADGWTVHRLSTVKQLEAEGETLAHCVGGGDYARRCTRGDIEIYSMRNADGASRYTIEVRKVRRAVGDRLREVRQVKGLKNARPKLAADCGRILAFLDQLPNVMPFDAAHDLEHCLRKAGRWIDDIRDIKPNRQTSRRRTSRARR